MGHSTGRSYTLLPQIIAGLMLITSSISWAKGQPIGQATALWGGFIKIYDATLYSPTAVNTQSLLADHTDLTLELCYHRSIDRKDIIKAAQKALPEALPNPIEQAINALHDQYQSVQKGDCYTLSHTPEEGTQLTLNDTSLFKTQTPGFKSAYFSIWLGDYALSETVKAQLLANIDSTSTQ